MLVETRRERIENQAKPGLIEAVNLLSDNAGEKEVVDVKEKVANT
jgi:hypothetical protein